MRDFRLSFIATALCGKRRTIVVGTLCVLAWPGLVRAGCPYDADCLDNPYGAGSPYQADGLKNPYGRYGSKYSPDSINNPYGAGSRYGNDELYVVPSR